MAGALDFPFVAKSAEEAEQLFGAFDGGFVRLIEPIELGGPFDSERMEQEDYFSQIAALDFWRVPVRPIEVAAFGPEPITGSRGSPAGAAFTLIGGGATDVFEEQCADTAFRVIASHTGFTAVYDVTNAIDGDGSFGDVCGDHNFAPWIRRKG